MNSSSNTDHYKVLGVGATASQDDVRKAYKKLAKEWHPDKNLNIKDSAELRFKQISEAHRVLSDNKLRREYDRAKENERYQRENEMRQREFEDRQRKKYNIQRMAKEQEDYVKKQEAKRRKAQRMRAAYADNNEDFTKFDDNEKFKNFFADRDQWRTTVPDLFHVEKGPLGGVVKDMMKMTSQMPFGGNGFSFDSGFTDSSSINQAFDRFFSEDPFSKLRV